MEYNDYQMPTVETMKNMNSEFNSKVNVCDVNMGENKQRAELEEIYEKLLFCEQFFKWLEGKDNFKEIPKMLQQTIDDKVSIMCCCRHGLDYRYACDSDFNNNCGCYCKCELEIIDKIIKLMTINNSILDKKCMYKLLQSRLDIFKMVFNNYCK